VTDELHCCWALKLFQRVKNEKSKIQGKVIWYTEKVKKAIGMRRGLQGLLEDCANIRKYVKIILNCLLHLNKIQPLNYLSEEQVTEINEKINFARMNVVNSLLRGMLDLF